MGKDECTLKKNYARTGAQVGLIHLSLVFSIAGSWTCGTLYHCPVRQATNIASFKTGVREFLAGNV